ncbi:MAG: multicopper oxidase domain-containing protein [Ottowia sp.]|nr:multicopper oxidase domain-containing protein [Ottowia sp.]
MTVTTRITGTGSYLPPRRVTNQELVADLASRGIESSHEWIVERTGIHARHFAAPDVAALPPTKEGAFHDTYPIDPGGWIKLRIRFDRPEQVGRFVYHCHILEHEDKGMMSVIQVVDTTH